VSNLNGGRGWYTARVTALGRRGGFLWLAAVVGSALAAYAVNGFWQRELSHLTGPAQWIWVTDQLEELHPQAALFVAALDLDRPPPSALLKVCGDREYIVYVNGTPAACGWSRPGFRLDLYDIAHLLRQGSNVVAAEVRSPTPAGGLLLSLDVEGVGRNVLTSGPAFVARPRFSLAAHAPLDTAAPVRWGSPPRFPWGYPKPLSHPRTLDEVVVEDALRIDAAAIRALPAGGWAISLPHPVFGYLWLEFAGDEQAFVTTTDHAGEDDPKWLRDQAHPAIRLTGQRRWLEPEPATIATVYVFGLARPVGAEIWPVSEDVSSTAPGVVQGSYGPVPRTRWTTRTRPE